MLWQLVKAKAETRTLARPYTNTRAPLLPMLLNTGSETAIMEAMNAEEVIAPAMALQGLCLARQTTPYQSGVD